LLMMRFSTIRHLQTIPGGRCVHDNSDLSGSFYQTRLRFAEALPIIELC
jgi:hypothetical protein